MSRNATKCNPLPYRAQGANCISYFGNKGWWAELLWETVGRDVSCWVEPFSGLAGAYVMRPEWASPIPGVLNDTDGFVANFLRAVRDAPDLVADAMPIFRVQQDFLAIRNRLQQTDLTDRLQADPEFYDPKIAGWWAWAMSAAIKNKPFRSRTITDANRKGFYGEPPEHRVTICRELALRLTHTWILNDDWTYLLQRNTFRGHRNPVYAILFDPPYGQHRDTVYRHDTKRLSPQVNAWCVEHADDPRYRILVTGWSDDHAPLAEAGFRPIPTPTRKQTGRQTRREGIWASPTCMSEHTLPITLPPT